MASFWSLWAMLMALLVCNCSLASVSNSQRSVKVSIISAAPASAPLVSPTQSPDNEPLFPTTPAKGRVAHSPSYSSLPTIPSSPSPPNPDLLGTPGTVFAFFPSEAPACYSYQLLYSVSCLTLPFIL
uniref:Uncharacterized protein n=1 Tax=Cajanus cajan TaxID=3821 RepID=A0A151TX49_CAJCA|nr:hypothetical protein KK1_010892 [Cajanus cajan]